MKTGTRFVFLILFMLCAAQFSCSGNSGTCSPRMVTMDAGIDGLPDVGEFGSPELCRVICGYRPDRCCRVKELTFTCTTYCE